MTNKSFEEELVEAIKPFHDGLVEFEKRTKLAIQPAEPLMNYSLGLKGKDLIKLSNIYRTLTETRIVIPEDFGCTNGDEQK